MIEKTINPTEWHQVSASEAARQLDVDPVTGLSSEEALARQRHYGPNRLKEAPPRSRWLLLADQFKGVLILVLIGAAVLAAIIGDLTDAVVILTVVLINAFLGFSQEQRAEQSIAALKKMLAPTAEVRRDGTTTVLSADLLVPGDIVLLGSGDRVPADGRVISAHSFEVDESTLTGESRTVGKHVESLEGQDLPLAERANLFFMNTIVTRGRAEMLITATGMKTELGLLAGMLVEAEDSPTPLQVQLDHLGRRLALIAGIVVAFMLLAGLLRGEPWLIMVMTAIALAVAAIPEGLPAVVTVTLAVGLQRMARNQAIVKRLAAVETLGCTSVICSDKTGTLTVNQMTARRLYTSGQSLQVSGEGYDTAGEITGDGSSLPDLEPLLKPVALCNDSQLRAGKVIGDPMDGALLSVAIKGGMDPAELQQCCPRIAEIPFDTEHKYQATFHLNGERVCVMVKGAPDVLLDSCKMVYDENGDQPLDALQRERIENANEEMAKTGLRVLAVAGTEVPARDFDPGGDLFVYVKDLLFTGLVGLMDPPRPEARDAIALCHEAGISIKMITGDQKITATAIASELGIVGAVVTSAELDAMSDAELSAKIDDIGVFTRATPEQKVRIVLALKDRGHVTAMTGDGVNDAPALKTADIGVAMGLSGTDVAREAATMVLTDDNFATIVKSVEEGRTIYDNIVKFVRFQLSTNIGAILTVLIAPFLGLPLPFTPIQLLWVNIIMDGPPAMALGVDPAQPDTMTHRPRKTTDQILKLRLLGKLMSYGLIMMIGTLGVFWWSLQNGSAMHAQSLAFTTFVLFQVFNAFNARVAKRSTFNANFFRNRTLWAALTGVVVLQVLLVQWTPAHSIFSVERLTGGDWLLATLVASSVLVLEEFRKLIRRIIWP
ncbi:MAG: calcium-transporting P-type ATPase, PMR1-type [Xanthomonadales bacterium]|nr:calcium-transporting P-type ATPase, PMR1-type [Xanthomonadales bacterium]